MCNVALLDSVSMCMCPGEPVRECTHICLSASAYVLACTSVFVCLCRSIKFCSHSCRLVSAWLWSVCLPLNLQPLLLFPSFFFSSEFFSCIPLFCIPLLLSFFSSSLLPVFSFAASFCLSPSMPSPSLPLSYSTPFFFFCITFASLWLFSLPLSHSFLKYFFFFKSWLLPNVMKQKTY